MAIPPKALDEAMAQGILSRRQADELQTFLARRPGAGPRFALTHVLYYLGALVAIGAMTVFMNLGWETFGGWGIFFICLLYAGGGLSLARRFETRGHRVPAGLCATFVVTLTPLALYGLQQALGWWPDDTPYRDYHRHVRWHWLYLELGTLAVGVIMAWRHRFPFMEMPIAVTLWYLSMDLAAMLVGGWPEFELRALVSLYFGPAFVGLAFWVDVGSRGGPDYAFWLYLFEAMTFWGGLTAQDSDSELARFGYLCVNLALMGVGLVLVRRVFLVFAALGCTLCLGHMASSVFRDSWLFPVALTAMGLGIIYLGILWQRHEGRILGWVHRRLPQPLAELLAHRAAG